MDNFIKIRGARQHNLQNINLDIPKNKFVVFTGVSGSGKSSLAFDTIYAEGQRRYVESLSAYARQFLGVMDKPDVDLIEGLSPAISIDQKTASHNPRSTVGTITEIYDYLRLLFARIGHPHCSVCGREVQKMSVDEIVQAIIEIIINPKFEIQNSKQIQNLNDKNSKHIVGNAHCAFHPPAGGDRNGAIEQWSNGSPVIYKILSPIVRQRKGEFKDLFANIRAKGFAKIVIDKKEIDLSKTSDLVLIKTNKHDVDVVIDTMSVSKSDTRSVVFMGNLKTRLRSAVEQATNLSDGLVILSVGEGLPTLPKSRESGTMDKPGLPAEVSAKAGGLSLLFSQKFSCPVCNISLPELEPRMFSFNSPVGACPKCKGLGTIYEIDTERILKKNLSVNEGGILPIRNLFFNDTWYARLIRKVAETESINLSVPIESLKKEAIEVLLHGTNQEYQVWGTNRFGHATKIHERFDGIVAELKRRYFGEHANGEIEGWDAQKYLKEEICPECHGDKLKPEVLAVTINELNIAHVCKFSVDKIIDWVCLLNSNNKKQGNTETQKGMGDTEEKRSVMNEHCSFSATQFVAKLNEYEQQVAKPILKEIAARLNFLRNVGLAYLTISRGAKTLSGGELQRIRLASQIGSGLTGVLYVLDEPSIGLHPKDVSALITSLKNLKDLGNTLIIVEHDEETIEAADHVVELGEWAGKNGGRITFEGTVAEMKKSKKSLTGAYLAGRKKILTNTNQYYQILSNTNKNTNVIPAPQRSAGLTPAGILIRKYPLVIRENQNSWEQITEESSMASHGLLELKGCTQFNLKNIDVKFPLGKLIAVTGVSGSGKSTLIVETLYPTLKYYLDGYYSESMGELKDITGYTDLKRVHLVDQSPIGRTPRSNPSTYVGFFDDIRDIYAATTEARARGFKKGRFSFNVKGGRCEKCEGAGVLKVEMQFLADVYVTCDVCHGKRYNSETLEVIYKGKTVSEILDMTVDEAADFFVNHPKISSKLMFLKQVGLGYISLGQAAPTFSGGEAQRIKLANELSKRDTGQNLYILDEPTTGLHFHDVQNLLTTLRELVARGNTVIVIEHNLDVIKNSDWIIDLGPDGGDAGGEVVYQGETSGTLRCDKSYTGAYLKKILKT